MNNYCSLSSNFQAFYQQKPIFIRDTENKMSDSDRRKSIEYCGRAIEIGIRACERNVNISNVKNIR